MSSNITPSEAELIEGWATEVNDDLVAFLFANL
jgi:hypothetical protein